MPEDVIVDDESRAGDLRSDAGPPVDAEGPAEPAAVAGNGGAGAAYRWSFVALGARTIVQALSGIVIARALGDPRLFGVGVLAISVYAVLAGVVAQGMNGPLLIRGQVTRAFLRRTLLADLGLGAGCALILTTVALLSSQEHRAGFLIGAVGCLVQSAGGASLNLTARALHFKRIATAESLGSLLGATAGLVLAATLRTPTALIVQLVTADVVILLVLGRVLLQAVPDLPPASRSEWAGRKYALNMAGTQLASTGSRNVGNWLVAALLGSHTLGLYGVAYRLMLIPHQNVAMVLSRVLVPRLRHIVDRPDDVRAEVRQLLLGTALLIGPGIGSVIPHARPLIGRIFGSSYADAGPATSFLLLAVFPMCCFSVASAVLASHGRSNEQFLLTSLSLLAAATAVPAGAHWGVSGVALAFVILQTFAAIGCVQVVRARLGVPARTFGDAAAFFVVCAAAGWCASEVIAGLLISDRDAPAGISTCAAVVLGAAIGWLAVFTALRSLSLQGLGFWRSMVTRSTD